MGKKVQHLVVDTTAFIKNVQLQELAENVYTTEGVVNEIKNNNQLKRLAVLPYNLKVKEPDADAVLFITEFSKKTGDFATLSAVDINVMSLTYQLEKQFCGTDHLKTEPIQSKTVYSATKPDCLKDNGLAGFYIPKNSKPENENEDSEESGEEEQEEESEENVLEEENEDTPEVPEDEMEKKLMEELAQLELSTEDKSNSEEILQPVQDTSEIQKEEPENNELEECESGEEEEDDDDDTWITPQNIINIKKNYGVDCDEEKDIEVGCITTDFAMQNVLKQIGLQVTTLDGRVIKHMRTFILRCYTCYKTTPDVTKIFCPKCGHKTLKRVAVSVDDKGEQVIHINARRQLTAKYKNQPLPLPKGGKHACNPILFEDQRLPQQRISKKAMLKTNALDDDYIANYSPFAMRDVDSRSALLRGSSNIKQWMKNYEYDNLRRNYKKYKK